MVVKRRLLLAVASALTLVLTAAAPMMAATKEAKPSPLRAASLLRVKDIAANGNTAGGSIVAIGWHEGSKPGQLYLAFSTDGGPVYCDDETCFPDVSHCCVFANAGGDSLCGDHSENLFEDPLFCDAEGGDFAGGAVRIAVHFMELTLPDQ